MGVELNFEELCKPYAGRPVEGAEPWTPSLQRQWLTEKEKIPDDIVDLAMVEVYSRLAAGETYRDGEALAYAIRAAAKKIRLKGHEAMLREFQGIYRDSLKTFGRAAQGRKKPGSIARNPVLALRWYRGRVTGFILGAGIVGAAWLLTTWLS